MLAGQEITVLDSFIIAITGISIVLIELALLALCVVIISKVVQKINFNNTPKEMPKAQAPTAKPIVNANTEAISSPTNEDFMDEIAAVMVAVIEESNLNPDEIIFKSIQQCQ